jgi:hypothetical protein
MAALCHACWIERTAQIRDAIRRVFFLDRDVGMVFWETVRF